MATHVLRAAGPLIAALGLLVMSPVSGQTRQGPHSYYENLIKRPEHLVSYSLRDPKELTPGSGWVKGRSASPDVAYAPQQDAHPRSQDAARLVIPSTRNSLSPQVRLPLPRSTSGFLLTWDAWWDEDFAFDRSGIAAYKAFQLESGGRIWTEVRSLFRRAAGRPGEVALVDVRAYGPSERRGGRLGELRFGKDTLGGMKTLFGIAPNTWTRYWVLLRPRPSGDGWWEFSLWLADERRRAVCLYEREAIRPRDDGWQRFWLEYNTSKAATKPGRGALISYVRNVVVLKPLDDMTPVLERPLPGPATPRIPLVPPK
ncbi:hypothetical protein [Luteitalea sp.]|jgi:hypothetical protein|uniref:hypothetical protein n=1 Tax=Luteitalea sp. TaxID=2004800 RepID=UPI0037C9EB41